MQGERRRAIQRSSRFRSVDQHTAHLRRCHHMNKARHMSMDRGVVGRRRAALIGALLCAAVMTFAGQARAATQQYGFNDPAWFNTTIPLSVEKAELSKAKAKYVRIGLS